MRLKALSFPFFIQANIFVSRQMMFHKTTLFVSYILLKRLKLLLLVFHIYKK